jgi:hypothetical protein
MNRKYSLPKQLIEVAGKPVIEHVLNRLPREIGELILIVGGGGGIRSLVTKYFVSPPVADHKILSALDPDSTLLRPPDARLRLSNPSFSFGKTIIFNTDNGIKYYRAEEVGFEPTKGVNPYRFSRAVPSTTRATPPNLTLNESHSSIFVPKCYNFSVF